MDDNIARYFKLKKKDNTKADNYEILIKNNTFKNFLKINNIC